MIGMDIKASIDTKPIERAVEKATFENIRHASFSLSKDAKSTIDKSSAPSEPGEAPHTKGKKGHNLKGAIFTNVQKDSGLIGPRASWVDDAGELHEFGERREGEDFDERPFMGPALDRAIPRFAQDWTGSIGQ
jgi:hypothetical protein